ncbi:MAG: bile acid:sodium symporter family protein [Mycobacteriaceae bacterium]|uniref:bile acid:sodium symporter family protein n=1 Tax=Corynebacterium sp. TaxID=1720 RepID=UPI003F9A4394
MKIDWFIVSLLGVLAVGLVLPASGSASQAVSWIATGAVVTLFLLNGLRMSPADVWNGARNWRVQGLILLTGYVVFPVLVLAVTLAASGVLDPDLAAGLVFLSTLPTTVQTCVIYTVEAGGNGAAALTAATASNLLALVLSPLLVLLMLGSHVSMGTGTVVSIVLQILLPFGLGQFLRPWWGPWATRHAGRLKYIDRTAILTIVYSAVSAATLAGVWETVSLTSLAVVVGVALGLLLVVSGFITLATRTTRLPGPDRTAVLFCGSQKSLTTGLPIAGALFPAGGLVIVPLMIYHVVQLIIGAAVARRIATSPQPAGVTP